MDKEDAMCMRMCFCCSRHPRYNETRALLLSHMQCRSNCSSLRSQQYLEQGRHETRTRFKSSRCISQAVPMYLRSPAHLPDSLVRRALLELLLERPDVRVQSHCRFLVATEIVEDHSQRPRACGWWAAEGESRSGGKRLLNLTEKDRTEKLEGNLAAGKDFPPSVCPSAR